MRGGRKRVFLITLDGVGVGALPDADRYGDCGANTLLHVAEACGGLDLPNLQKMGLGNVLSLPGVTATGDPSAFYGRMRERSAGKDTTTGHWEIAGVIQTEPFATFPSGFPAEIIDAFRRETGLDPLGNIAASGTDILVLLGEEHLATGRPIVYTSADSVFQIAAHEEIIPLERLYDICRSARKVLDRWSVGRVIARPFRGSCAAGFARTAGRHDFSLPPTAPTVLDALAERGGAVYGIGKIRDIFAGRGITDYVYTGSNAEGMTRTVEAAASVDKGLIFTNLVDFDMVYGHRLDAAGFGRALEEFDAALPSLLDLLEPSDLLLVTADHGCDPTTPGTDHSREYVPLLAWSPGGRRGGELGERESFCDIAATVAHFFSIPWSVGRSFWGEMNSEAGRIVAG